MRQSWYEESAAIDAHVGLGDVVHLHSGAHGLRRVLAHVEPYLVCACEQTRVVSAQCQPLAPARLPASTLLLQSSLTQRRSVPGLTCGVKSVRCKDTRRGGRAETRGGRADGPALVLMTKPFFWRSEAMVPFAVQLGLVERAHTTTLITFDWVYGSSANCLACEITRTKRTRVGARYGLRPRAMASNPPELGPKCSSHRASGRS